MPTPTPTIAAHVAILALRCIDTRNAYFCLRIELREEYRVAPPELVAAVTAAARYPKLMKLTKLADVRDLIRRLPKDHGTKSTWQHVEKQLNAAAVGAVDTVDVAVPLQMVLSMEGVTCLPQ